MLRRILASITTAALLAVAGPPAGVTTGAIAEGAPAVGVFEGEIQGAPFRVEVPAAWNGTLLLWNRTPIFRPEQLQVANDELTRRWLLEHGVALAASNYRTPAGVVFAEPLEDQIALLDTLVRRAYDEAGLDLAADLERLATAPRISADQSAVGWVAQLTPTGRIRVPVLTLHATGDGAAVPEHERWYAEQARRSGDQDMLRQLFTGRGGHCAFTPSELIVTIQALLARLGTGRWPATGPAGLNAAARALGPEFQVAPDWGVTFQPRPADPAFVTYEPGRLPRPFPPAG